MSTTCYYLVHVVLAVSERANSPCYYLGYFCIPGPFGVIRNRPLRVLMLKRKIFGGDALADALEVRLRSRFLLHAWSFYRALLRSCSSHPQEYHQIKASRAHWQNARSSADESQPRTAETSRRPPTSLRLASTSENHAPSGGGVGPGGRFPTTVPAFMPMTPPANRLIGKASENMKHSSRVSAQATQGGKTQRRSNATSAGSLVGGVIAPIGAQRHISFMPTPPTAGPSTEQSRQAREKVYYCALVFRAT